MREDDENRKHGWQVAICRYMYMQLSQELGHQVASSPIDDRQKATVESNENQ